MSERLEHVKQYYSEVDSMHPDLADDIKWLIKQAEYAEDLEYRYNECAPDAIELRKENKRLNQEIGRYSNRVFEIANEGYAIGGKARELINEMVGGQ